MFTCIVKPWYLLATSGRNFSNLHFQSILLTPSSLRFWRQQVKQSLYRTGQALRAPEGSGCHTLRQSAHEGGKLLSPKHRPLLLPIKHSRYSFLLQVESTPEPKCGRKDYVNEKPQWIEAATFRLLAQCLPNLNIGGRNWFREAHVHS